MAMLVVRTRTRSAIQQAARNIGGVQFTRVLILQFVDAAFATTVAQRLPLRPV